MAAWEAKVPTFREMPDAELEAARAALDDLIIRLEVLVDAANEAPAIEPEILSGAHLALLRARHGVTWAGWVLHERLPPTDLSKLV